MFRGQENIKAKSPLVSIMIDQSCVRYKISRLRYITQHSSNCHRCLGQGMGAGLNPFFPLMFSNERNIGIENWFSPHPVLRCFRVK